MRTCKTKHSRFMRLGLAGSLAALALSAGAASAQADFGVVPGSFSARTTNSAGVSETQAGARVDATTSFRLNPTHNANGFEVPDEDLKDVVLELPPGVVGNPIAAAQCTASEFGNGRTPPQCPTTSQVGVAEIPIKAIPFQPAVEPLLEPIYNLVPQKGKVAQFGFVVGRDVIVITAKVRSAGDYGITATARNNPGGLFVFGADITLWGVPAAEAHDPLRYRRGAGAPGDINGDPLPSQAAEVPFFTNPANCDGVPPVTKLAVTSWQHPANEVRAEATSPPTTGCEKLSFKPNLRATPSTTNPDSPSGLSIELTFPQNESPEGLATPPLKDARVTLPEGMTINPASAGGLGACSDQELGLHSEAPIACPDSSKIGEVRATTPVLAEPLTGSVYLRSQASDDPESGDMFRIALVLENPARGLLIKLPGQVKVHSQSGRVEALFSNNPQLPVSTISVDLKTGPRAPLATPNGCGTKTTNARLTAWSGQVANLSDSFDVPCPAGNGFSPSAEAGTVNPLGGQTSPFVLRLRRDDGQQMLSGLNVKLPPGLTAYLRGIPYCPDASLAAAQSRRGREELASPSCPAGSKIGAVEVAAGAGSMPYRVGGTAYLAGPYKGAPLSMAVITPAVAGPFDLGTVVVRAALQVNPMTAEITAVSDPLPQIVAGVPLRLRSVEVDMDRPQFTLNPTNCDPMQIGAQLTGAGGSVANLSSRFQVGNCASLPFRPKLKLHLKGSTTRTGHPALKAVVTYPKEGTYANIARAQVGLPHSEFLDQGNLNKVCKQADLKAGTCPKSSIYGWAKAWTPLLDKPLQGPVYLGVGFGYKLPALVADLNGQIRIMLVGRVDTTKRDGIRNTFEVVPDAPVSRFVLRMKGGKKYGLLENSENTCRKKQRASALFIGQNGDRLHMRPRIHNGCGKAKRNKAKRKAHARASSQRQAAHGGRGRE